MGGQSGQGLWLRVWGGGCDFVMARGVCWSRPRQLADASRPPRLAATSCVSRLVAISLGPSARPFARRTIKKHFFGQNSGRPPLGSSMLAPIWVNFGGRGGARPSNRPPRQWGGLLIMRPIAKTCGELGSQPSLYLVWGPSSSFPIRVEARLVAMAMVCR